MSQLSGNQPANAATETLKRVKAKFHSLLPEDGYLETKIPGMHLYRKSSLSTCTSTQYEPALLLFVGGEKQIDVGNRQMICSEGTLLLTSVDLPATSQITKATAEDPVLCLAFRLDMPMVREILATQDLSGAPQASTSPRGMTLSRATAEVLAAFERLLDVLTTPEHIDFLGDLIQREILYRLLLGAEGRHLRAIATLGEQSNRTARAVAWLRDNYSKPLRVEELASLAQMGVSTFHHHFRTLTSMSPLQYQKQLRLHVARERMLTEGLDASSAAYEVGYESPSQFNREYRRFFGQPPMRDVKARRNLGELAMAE